MNTAVRDGYDLGWKLGLGAARAGPSRGLLDAYEAERRPVAEHNVARSADPTARCATARAELHADLGGRIPHVWLPARRPRARRSTCSGPALTLFTGPDAGAWARRRRGRRAPADHCPRAQRDDGARDGRARRRSAAGAAGRDAGGLVAQAERDAA